MCGHGVRLSKSKMVCSWRTCRPPGLRDTFATMSSVIESKTEWPPMPKMEEPGQSVRICLMIGLRSAALVGDDELRVRIVIASQRYSYVQSSPVILAC